MRKIPPYYYVIIVLILIFLSGRLGNSNPNKTHYHNHYENEINDIKKILSLLEDKVSILENKDSLILDFESRPVNESHKHPHVHTNIPKIMKKLSELENIVDKEKID